MPAVLDPPAPVVLDDLRRREFLAGVLAAGLLAGCGDDATDDGSGDDDAFPATVAHSFGRTTIGSKPQRIVSLDLYETDDLLALGVQPIAINHTEGERQGIARWQRERLVEPLPRRLRYTDGYPIEEVAALRPDLILGSYPRQDDYRLLSRIAPTIVLDYEVSTERRALAVGRAVGLEPEARRAVADLQRSIRAARAKVGLDGLTVAIGAYSPGEGIYPGTDESGRGELRALGALPPPGFAGLSSEEVVSLERLDRFEADVLYIACTSESEANELRARPVFQALDVVERGAALVSGELLADDYVGFKGLLSVRFALETFYPRLGRLAAGR